MNVDFCIRRADKCWDMSILDLLCCHNVCVLHLVDVDKVFLR